MAVRVSAAAVGSAATSPGGRLVDLEGFALAPDAAFSISVVLSPPVSALEAVNGSAGIDSPRVVAVYQTEAQPPPV